MTYSHITDFLKILHFVGVVFIIVLVVLNAQLFWVRLILLITLMLPFSSLPGVRAHAGMEERGVSSMPTQQAGRHLPARQ